MYQNYTWKFSQLFTIKTNDHNFFFDFLFFLMSRSKFTKTFFHLNDNLLRTQFQVDRAQLQKPHSPPFLCVWSQRPMTLSCDL